ncbi:MAG: hypothetical protein WBN60_16975, partial [Polyangiales bacterium]
AAAQQRTNEFVGSVGIGGTTERDFGFARLRDELLPSYGLALRFAGRVAERPWGEIHLGARVAGAAWQTRTLQDTEDARRALLDVGPFVRWRGRARPIAPVLGASVGFSATAPSIPEIFSGVRFGLGLYSELWLGGNWQRKRALLGLELAWSYHHWVSNTPDVTISAHQAVYRLVVGWTGPKRLKPARPRG